MKSQKWVYQEQAGLTGRRVISRIVHIECVFCSHHFGLAFSLLPVTVFWGRGKHSMGSSCSLYIFCDVLQADTLPGPPKYLDFGMVMMQSLQMEKSNLPAAHRPIFLAQEANCECYDFFLTEHCKMQVDIFSGPLQVFWLLKTLFSVASLGSLARLLFMCLILSKKVPIISFCLSV